MMEFKELENDLVRLIPLREENFERLFAVGNDKTIWEQHPDVNRYTREGFTKYFEHLMTGNIAYFIVDKVTGQPIGATSFYQYNEDQKSVAIGYTFLAKAYWGGVYNSSVKSLMLDHAFQFVDKVVFHVRDKNYRSQVALAKIGAVKTDSYPAAYDAEALQFVYTVAKPRPNG